MIPNLQFMNPRFLELDHGVIPWVSWIYRLSQQAFLYQLEHCFFLYDFIIRGISFVRAYFLN